MYYLGVDYHKYFSYCTLLDYQGSKVLQTRIVNAKEVVANLCHQHQPVVAVMEASRNWEVMYDWLEELTDRVVLAHPLKVKAIASAKIKTDKIDAAILAQLLRADLVPAAHVPGMETREARATLRQRMFFVRLQTAVKNRITTVVDRYQLKPPTKSLFTQKGIEWLKLVPFKDMDKQLLFQDIILLESLQDRIAQSNQLVSQIAGKHEDIALLRSIPGLGPFFSVLVYYEIDGIDRFRNPKKLSAYAGLIPSTYQSGNKTFKGRLTKEGNKWLRYALVEAVYPAIRKDMSLKAFYEQIKNRKGANPAKVATARRLLTIVYRVLKQHRKFEVRLPC